MAYYRKWRKYQAEAEALALESTEEEDNVEENIFLDADQVSDVPHFSTENVQEDVHALDESEICENFIPDRPLSSSESESEEICNDLYDDTCFEDELRSFFVDSRLPREYCNRMLGMLRKRGFRLPKDSRTLLKSPRSVDTQKKCGGDYIYFGLESAILTFLAQYPDYKEQSIELQINVDGIPIFKSSSYQFWPILAKFGPFKPFIVALYSGKSKPTPICDYLEDFLEEYTRLACHGIECNNEIMNCSIHSFICDAPARSMIKVTKGHTGYNACERCTIHGEWQEGRVVYHDYIPTEKRNDDEFNKQGYADHQFGISPLSALGFPCVQKFPLDYMHLVCLGVVRRLIYYLKKGPRLCKLSQLHLTEISNDLNALNGRLPSEFARQPRGLDELDRWKATEFRQFLLYTGMVVLKKCVPSKVYDHFLLLTVAITILSSGHDGMREAYMEYAEKLLQKFVKDARVIYGSTFVVYNVHGLLHLTDDVKTFHCPLNDISAFPFENFLQEVKKLVKIGKNPIVQVAKRMAENRGNAKILDTSKAHRPKHISNKVKDSCFQMNNKDFAIVKGKCDEGTYLCDIYKQRHLEDFFTKPCPSKLIDIAFSKSEQPSSTKILKKQELAKKAIALPYKTGMVLIPVLH